MSISLNTWNKTKTVLLGEHFENSKNTDVLFHFPVPKSLEVHSELSDWISKSSMGKLQPFILLNHIMGQRQHKHPLSVSFPSFKSFQMSIRPTAAEATPVQYIHIITQIGLLVLSQVRLLKTQASDGNDTWRKEELVSPFTPLGMSYTDFLFCFFCSSELLYVRSSPRHRPYFRRT